MEHGPPRRRRARPVADAPVDALLTRAEELAKGWLLALLEQVPLDGAASILAADMSRDGPRVCAAVVRAIADDIDLRRLQPGGALEPLAARAGQIAGAADPAAAGRAVDALHAVIWSALRAELPATDAEQIAQIAERLTLVTDQVRLAVLSGFGAGGARDGAAERIAGARRTDPEPRPDLRVTRTESHATAPGGPAVHPEPASAGSGADLAEPASAGSGADLLWVEAVEEEIDAARRGGAPLSLVLAELEDRERVSLAEAPGQATATFSRFAQALRSAVRRQDLLACETDSRAWIIARETGRPGARALAERLALAVEREPPWRGAPMRLVAGVAVLGEDGDDAGALAEAAEEAKFAAAARGVPVVNGEGAGHGSGGEPPIAG